VQGTGGRRPARDNHDLHGVPEGHRGWFEILLQLRRKAGGNGASASGSGAVAQLQEIDEVEHGQEIGRSVRGVAAYLDLDVTLVRVLWVLAFLCGGTGLLLYVILWIVLPVEPFYVPVSQTPATPST